MGKMFDKLVNQVLLHGIESVRTARKVKSKDIRVVCTFHNKKRL